MSKDIHLQRAEQLLQDVGWAPDISIQPVESSVTKVRDGEGLIETARQTDIQTQAPNVGLGRTTSITPAQ